MNDYFKELEKIEKRRIENTYLLVGNDLYMKQEFVRTLFEVEPSTEKKIYYANQNEDVDFLDNLMSFGLFATKKIIVYYDIDKFTNKYKEKLLNYLVKPEKTTTLVFITGKGKIKFVQQIAKNAKNIKVWPPYPNKYVDFVTFQIRRMGFDATGEAINLLASITNDSLHHTFAEFEKVLINTGTGRKITDKDVKKVVGGEKKYTMQDFIEAIGNKNFYKAIEICEALVQMGIATPYFVLSLYNFFNDMYVCFVEDVSKMFSYNWQWRQLISGSIGNYRRANFEEIFHHLNETDIKGKSTGLSTQELIVPLIYEIVNA